MRQYKPLALFISTLFLPVTIIGIAEATKPTKPVDELETRVTQLEADVSALDAEVAGLSEQNRWK